MSPTPSRPSQSTSLNLREPFSGLSHLTGALLGTAALVVLVSLAQGKPWHLSGFAIYGATLILLYTASTLYHSLPVGERGVRRLLMLDRIGPGSYWCSLIASRLSWVSLTSGTCRMVWLLPPGRTIPIFTPSLPVEAVEVPSGRSTVTGP